jgi:hypothetical protein
MGQIAALKHLPFLLPSFLSQIFRKGGGCYNSLRLQAQQGMNNTLFFSK